jgi:hypothetical protein
MMDRNDFDRCKSRKIFDKQDNIKSSSIVSRTGGDRVIWEAKEFQLEPILTVEIQ